MSPFFEPREWGNPTTSKRKRKSRHEVAVGYEREIAWYFVSFRLSVRARAGLYNASAFSVFITCSDFHASAGLGPIQVCSNKLYTLYCNDNDNCVVFIPQDLQTSTGCAWRCRVHCVVFNTSRINKRLQRHGRNRAHVVVAWDDDTAWPATGRTVAHPTGVPLFKERYKKSAKYKRAKNGKLIIP